MNPPERIRPTPWDRAALDLPCFEILDPGREILASALATPGHYTVKVDPLADKRELHELGFYYCDTLIEPWCTSDRLAGADDAAATLSDDAPLDPLLGICRDAFRHGRFHRDWNIPHANAERRYANWLAELHGQGNVIALLHRGALAGFIARNNGRLVLHAMAESFRGRGLARPFWTLVCRRLFGEGHPEVTSSVSAANVQALNLYASLGFRFRNPVDIYHRVVP